MLRKIVLLLWKNFVIRKRHWFLTTVEIIIPVLLFVLAAFFYSEIDVIGSTNVIPGQIFEPKNEKEILDELHNNLGKYPVLYAPTMSETSFVSSAMKNLKSKTHIEIKGFDNERELLTYYSNLNTTTMFEKVHAIIFEDLPSDGSIPKHLKYKIRIASHIPQYTDSLFPEDISTLSMQYDTYEDTGFVGLQLLLDKVFMEMWNVLEVPNIQIQKFPYPEHTADKIVLVLSVMLSLFAVISFVITCTTVIQRVVEEKCSGVKELMKMMGLSTWMLWLGWFINALLVNIISVTIIVLCLKNSFSENNGILNNSNPLLVWVFLMLYCSATILFSFAVSTFFSRPTLATNVGMVLWFLSYSLTSWMAFTSNVPVGLQLLTSLIPNFAVCVGFHKFMQLEAHGDGVNWSNLFEGDLAVGYIFSLLIVDCILFTLITFYVEATMPGKYGLAKPACFIFMPSFWKSRKVDNMNSEDTTLDRNMVLEPPPPNLEIGIRIRNLHKVFQGFGGKNPKVAVDGVSLDMYKGEITALLGHNGAGKTTTMSILTGLFSASSGSVHINGYDINTDLNKVRECLGLCPQHSLLFINLTVMEHLIFFAMLKGCSMRKAKQEAEELMEQLNLTEKKNKMVSDLSGGMKRKLSLGIALIGDSKVLMLDEPTSGMDPEARRAIWDMLLSMRGQRTILITTHFMEEADVLGDRIAIMDHGRIRCYGTSLFLKKHYGTGYQLALLKQDTCDVSEVTRTLQRIIPEVVLKSETGSLICYSLPTETAAKFPELFDALESKKSALGISSIGMSITTLDEVFLKAGKESEDEHDGTSNGETSIEYTKLNTDSLEALTFEKLKGLSLFWQQIRALFIKQILFSKRRWWILLLHAAGLLLLTIWAVKAGSSRVGKEESPLELQLQKYGQTIVMYNNDTTKKHVEQYVQTVRKTNSLMKETHNVNSSLLSVGEEDLKSYLKNYIVAANFNSSITALYSVFAYHSLPISLNLIMNSLLSPLGNTISVINHPLNQIEGSSDGGGGTEMKTAVMTRMLLLIPTGLIFFIGRFLIMPNEERISKAKQLQYMSGVSPPMYWFAYFCWDFLLYVFVIAIMLMVVLVFDNKNYFSGAEEMGTLMLLLFLYGLSGIPSVYFFSYIGKTSTKSFSFLITLHTFTGLILPLIVYFLAYSTKYMHIAEGLKYILELTPQFALSLALIHFSFQAVENNQCKSVSCKEMDTGYCCRNFMGKTSHDTKPYLVFPSIDNPNGLMVEVLYLAFDTVLFFLLLGLLDYNILDKALEAVLQKVFGTNVTSKNEVDADVVQEQDRVDGQLEGTQGLDGQQNDIMLVHDLVKKYKGRFAAVKGISFGVMVGECFGLLGVNGAGKTTIFKMLTGDEIPTRGDATILNYTLSKHKKKYLRQIGYCPQFDAINEVLTGREMLQMYAHLRGVPRENVDQEANKWLTLLGLREYENRYCGTYSGGNKRRLSTAMALIGEPPIVFLDEPTSGVDPVARRNFWSILAKMQKSGQSIVLTSHSMDECEALCSRLAIMVAGQFVCMGPIQYLKQKFGQGFTIMLKLKVMGDYSAGVQMLKNNFEQHPLFVGNCVLKDEHQGLLHYHITNPNILWSQLFKTMEGLRNTHNIIEDYTVTETSLEQVFLSFAKGETPE